MSVVDCDVELGVGVGVVDCDVELGVGASVVVSVGPSVVDVDVSASAPEPQYVGELIFPSIHCL